jgi:dipeptidyl aminopeptidase/acylaminoacyl peptidase
MNIKRYFTLVLLLMLVHMTGCSFIDEVTSATLAVDPGLAKTPIIDEATHATQPPSSTPTASPTLTITPTPTATEVIYDIGKELTIQYLRDLKITGSEITFEEQLAPTFYYERHIVSYISEGNKIFGLFTIPREEQPDKGFKAIIFNHGYIPPATYRTTERYEAYVDYLAKSGFVVLKIDFRGHGESEGEPQGTYFSPGYTIDAIAALKSLQTLDFIDPEGIGMWGHSMAGNLTLRAMLIEPEIKAGVIWAGAVYSYDDFAEYGIDDNTYRPPATPQGTEQPRRSQQIFDAYGRPDSDHPYWLAVSLTENIEFLESPLQIHHAMDDTVVRIDYSYGLVAVLQENDLEYELYIYEAGGHNLVSPSFGLAMQRTVAFLQTNL